MADNTQRNRIDAIETSFNNISNVKEDFQASIYPLTSTNKTYQKFILTENTQFINNIKETYYINHTPAAQGMCLFNQDKGGD